MRDLDRRRNRRHVLPVEAGLGFVQVRGERRMNYVRMGKESVSVASISDAKALMKALSEFNCSVPLMRQEIIGKECETRFLVCFGDNAIGTEDQDSAELIMHWLLDLGCDTVTIEKSKE